MSTPEDGADVGKRVRRGLAWVGLASSLVGALDILAIGLMVAFWVPKQDVGVAFIVVSLFPVLDIATDLGMAAALIQRDDHSQSRMSTVFWLNILMSLALFALLAFGIGPLLVFFHKQPVLTGMLMLYGCRLIWQNVYFLPYALMKKELRFKELSVIRIIANVVEFASKVGFAIGGFGVWSFVVGPLARVFVTGVGVQICNPWRPSFVFKFSEGWDWAKFGLKTSAHKILFRLYSMVDIQVVGYYFGPADLAVYAIAYRIVLEPAVVIAEITGNVAFPAFSKLKNDTGALYEQLVAFCKMNLTIMLLFVGITFVAAEEILAILSASKDNDYTSGAPIIRLLCGVAILRALSFVIPPFLDGVGRPTLTLIYTATAAAVLSAFFVLFAYYFGPSLGFTSVALAWLMGYPIAFAVLVYMAFQILEVPSYRFYRRLAGIMLCGLAATALAAVTKLAAMGFPMPLRAALVLLVGVSSYSALLSRFQGINIRSVKQSLKS
ncbi:MAG: oligosaccharide flippase family protein [Myxococcales bacterium]|nr:oligosaccharide flippase family protein [Myxococcales bacterium]